jgi:hypothetical protein
MIGKFNITPLGQHDQILLGIPWLHAMDPLICWNACMLSLSHTPKSDSIEDVDTKHKKNRLPPLFAKVPKYAHSKLPKKSVKPECVDSTILVPAGSVKPEHIDSTIPLTASIEEIPDGKERPAPTPIPNKTSGIFDTKEDIWENFKPPVYDVSTYLLCDNNVLIKHQANGSEMCVIEDVSFDTPLT